MEPYLVLVCVVTQGFIDRDVLERRLQHFAHFRSHSVTSVSRSIFQLSSSSLTHTTFLARPNTSTTANLAKHDISPARIEIAHILRDPSHEYSQHIALSKQFMTATTSNMKKINKCLRIHNTDSTLGDIDHFLQEM